MIEYDSRKILIYLAVKYGGDSFKIINAVRSREDEHVPYEEIEKVCNSVKSNVITYLDEEFPECLKKMFRPPLVLFYYGDISLLNDDKKRYAILGSKKCSEYSKKATKKFVNELGTDKVLVSGLSKGIDTTAHIAALDSSTKTIAVLANGIDYCYTKENKILYEKIKNEGLIISEYPGMLDPDKLHYPMSSRLVVGLSEALIVPQVNSHTSGTTIAINLAVGDNKPVYVLPHSIFYNSMNNEIIQEGANIALDGMSILEDLHWKG